MQEKTPTNLIINQDEDWSFLPFFYNKALFSLQEDIKVSVFEEVSPITSKAEDYLKLVSLQEAAILLIVSPSVSLDALTKSHCWEKLPSHRRLAHVMSFDWPLNWSAFIAQYSLLPCILVCQETEWGKTGLDFCPYYFHDFAGFVVLALEWPVKEESWNRALAMTDKFWTRT
ncbi:MAG: hypothetical protein EAZ57_07200 [Cytophagales bacterium]|nr:MAG: hypothetical protein EAZ67_08010 [Cytophagales bacterium]TAF60488.1 MAG: hypothetical protein EAZ57_07200 [Cytophagales bacterium]